MALGLTNGSMTLRYAQLMKLNLTAAAGHGEAEGGAGGHHKGAGGGHHQARAKSADSIREGAEEPCEKKVREARKKNWAFAFPLGK